MSCLSTVKFRSDAFKGGKEDINGVLIADKVGEIYFLNTLNLHKLPEEPEKTPNKNEPAADTFDFPAKLVYAHQ